MTKELYDLAENHLSATFPDHLYYEKAHLHIGIYLGWIIKHDLFSKKYMKDFILQVEQFKRNTVSPIVLSILFVGRLSSVQMSERGKAFSDYYYKSGLFRRDYSKILASDLPNIYEVEESWDNFHRMCEYLDKVYEKWEQKHYGIPTMEMNVN